MKSLKPVVIVGTGGHALTVADAAESSGWRVVGFFSDQISAINAGTLASLDEVSLAEVPLALGIGANFNREDAYKKITQTYPEARFVTIIHPDASISQTSTLANGTVVLAQASIGPGACAGVGCILNTGSSLDHESSLGDFSSLGPGARTGGSVRIGKRSMVGMQVSVLQGTSIGDDTVIGANSLVRADVASNIVAWGTPAETIRTRAREDSYY